MHCNFGQRKLQVSGGIDNRRSLVFHFLGLQIVDVSKEGKEKHGKSKSKSITKQRKKEREREGVTIVFLTQMLLAGFRHVGLVCKHEATRLRQREKEQKSSAVESLTLLIQL
jgi:hypothetical protein